MSTCTPVKRYEPVRHEYVNILYAQMILQSYHQCNPNRKTYRFSSSFELALSLIVSHGFVMFDSRTERMWCEPANYLLSCSSSSRRVKRGGKDCSLMMSSLARSVSRVSAKVNKTVQALAIRLAHVLGLYYI